MRKEFELYQDEEGNVYDITTDLEQIIIKDLYKAMKRNNEKQDEIERLHSIIKEVREYIEENQEEHKYTDRGGFTYTEGHFLRDSDTLLEILDKEKV